MRAGMAGGEEAKGSPPPAPHPAAPAGRAGVHRGPQEDAGAPAAALAGGGGDARADSQLARGDECSLVFSFTCL